MLVNFMKNNISQMSIKKVNKDRRAYKIKEHKIVDS